MMLRRPARYPCPMGRTAPVTAEFARPGLCDCGSAVHAHHSLGTLHPLNGLNGKFQAVEPMLAKHHPLFVSPSACSIALAPPKKGLRPDPLPFLPRTGFSSTVGRAPSQHCWRKVHDYTSGRVGSGARGGSSRHCTAKDLASLIGTPRRGIRISRDHLTPYTEPGSCDTWDSARSRARGPRIFQRGPGGPARCS